MLRRSLSARRLQVEGLELRCNLSAIAPLGAAPAEPAAETFFDGRFLAARDLSVDSERSSNTNNYFTDDYSLSVGSDAEARLGMSGYLKVKKLNSGG